MNKLVTIAAVAGLAAAASAQTFTGAGGAIPDFAASTPGVFTSSVNVASNLTIADLTLDLNGLTHTWAGDLIVTLSNGTTTATIFSRVGSTTATGAGDSSNFGGDYSFANTGADFWAAAAAAPATGSLIAPGAYAATGALSAAANNAFAAFFGQSAAGTWTLRITDNAGLDTGTLRDFDLNFTLVPAPAGAGVLALGGLVAARRRRG